MATLIGVVSQVVGEVFAVASDGSRRPLSEGDRVYAGEQLLTGASGAIAVALSNGQQLTLGRDSSLTLDEQMLASSPTSQAPTADAAPPVPSDSDLTDVEQLQAAIEAGVDPTLEGEATAAGPGAGGGAGGAGGGHSFVLLSEVGGALDPVIGFPTEGLSTGPEFPDGEPIVDPDIAPQLVEGLPVAGEASNAVDEEGLPGGIVGGPNDLAGEDTVVTGTLGYSFGPNGIGSFAWSSEGLAALGISSQGVSLTYSVSADGLTLSAFAGETLVFTLQLTDLAAGTYQFSLFAPLDHAAPEPGGSDENDLFFLFGYSITDGAGNTALGSLTLGVDDDTPELQGVPGERPSVGGLVHEDALSNGNSEGGGQTLTLSGGPGALDALVNFGADGRGSFSLNGSAEALDSLIALGLTSDGVALTYSVSADGTTLVATAGGNPVFTLVVNPDGSYLFTLQGPLDHPEADGVDSETLGDNSLALDFSGILQATDFDGDAVAGGFDAGSFVIDVEDDVPVLVGAPGERPTVGGLVHEDALSNGNSEGGGQTLTLSGGPGALDALVNFGADGRGGFQLSIDPGALIGLQDLNLTSGGVELFYAVSADGSTLTATAGEGGAPVFTLLVNPDGSYLFTLQGPLDHPEADGVDSETLGDSSLALDFSGLLVATDGDGDPLADGFDAGSFVIDIEDDVPVLVGAPGERPSVGGLVHEDALGNGNSEGGGQTLTLSGEPGALDALVNFGADGRGGFQLSIDPGALIGLQDLNLTSGGVELFYAVSADGSTLTATAGEGGAPVFTLLVNPDGSYLFTLQGPLDHPEADGVDSETLGDNSLALDFSGLLVATDGDGDPLAAGFDAGSFVIDVEDDVPTLNEPNPQQPAVGGTVHEDLLSNPHTGNAEGGSQTLSISTAGGAGSLAALVAFGADGPGSFGLVNEVTAEALLGAGGQNLTSGGEPLVYEVTEAYDLDGNLLSTTLTATAAGGYPVFTLVVQANGDFSFELQGPIDHPEADGDDGELFVSVVGMGIDFTQLITATDGDGDPLNGLAEAQGLFVINIEDDVPTINEPNPQQPAVGGTVHEDLLSNPHTGNAEGGSQTLSISTAGGAGSLAALVAFGADGPGSFGLVNEATAEALLGASGQNLTSGGEPLVYEVTEAYDPDGNLLSTTLTATAAGGYPVFTLVVQANGDFSFELQGPIDHPVQDGDDDELWASAEGFGIDFTQLITATDGDGDPLQMPAGAGGLFVVNVEDDVPALVEGGLDHCLTLTYKGGDASFLNSYGYYIKGADGTPVSGVLVWGNTTFLEIGASISLHGLDPDSIGFFIIPNGAFNVVPDGTEVSFQFVDGQWQAVAAGLPLNGAGGAQVLFDNPALNPASKTHVQDNVAPGNQNWEDVNNGDSDNDYNDVNIQATWTIKTPAPVGGTVHEDKLTNPHQGNPDAGSQTLVVSTALGATSLAALVAFGADGPGDFSLVDSGAAADLLNAQGLTSGGEPLIYLVTEQFDGAGNLVSTTLTATAAGGYPVFSLVVEADGDFTFTLQGPIDHPLQNGDDNELWSSGGAFGIDFTQLLKITDGDGDPLEIPQGAGGLFVINVQDDVPTLNIDLVGPNAARQLSMNLDETVGAERAAPGETADGNTDDPVAPDDYLGRVTTNVGNGGLVSLFSVTGSAGADGESSLSGSLSFVGIASGASLTTNLFSTSGSAIHLEMDGADVIGVDADGDVVFRLAIVDTGSGAQLQTTLYESIRHGDNTAFDEQLDLLLTGQGASLGLQYSVTRVDGDGDSVTATKKIVLADGQGSILGFDDDGPIAKLALNGQVKLTLDESLGVDPLDGNAAADDDVSGNPFPGGYGTPIGLTSGNLVNVVTADVGSDDEGATVQLSLSVVDANSGLMTTSGQPITLHQESDGSITGRVGGASGTVIFAVSIDAAGKVTVAQYDSLKHPTSPNDYDESVDLAGKIEAVLKVTDGDNDVATSKVGIGGKIVFEDDGPSVTPPDCAEIEEVDGFSTQGVIQADYGSDGGGFDLSANAGPTADGLFYTVVKQGGVSTLTATVGDASGEVFFVLTVYDDPNALGNGNNYELTIVNARPVTTADFDLQAIEAGQPQPSFLVQSGEGLSVTLTGNGLVNPSNQGVGVGGNNLIDVGEQLHMAFSATVYSAVVDVQKLSSGDQLYWQAYDGSNNLVAAGTYNGQGSESSQFGFNLADSAFTTGTAAALSGGFIKLTFGSNAGDYRIQEITLEQQFLPPDLDLSFQVDVVDGDNDVVSTQLDVCFVDDVPSGGYVFDLVDEEGLAGGIIGGVEDDDGAATTASGSLGYDYGNDGFGSFTWLPDGLPTITSGGQAVEYQVSPNGQVLTAQIVGGGQPVFTVTLTNPATGAFQFQLFKPLDHAAPLSGSVENNLNFQFDYEMVDGNGSTAQGVLEISVDDDSPLAQDLSQSREASGDVNTNLLIVLDVSGSMNDPADFGGLSRLEASKLAVLELLEQYEAMGEVKVRLVTFANSASAFGTLWLTVDQAKAAVIGFPESPDSATTNYDAALSTAISAWASAGKLTLLDNPGEPLQNVSYFLSDGIPNQPSGSAGINASEEATWVNFLNANKVKSYALGMGPAAEVNDNPPGNFSNNDQLDPIAYDGTSASNANAIAVNDFADLESVLVQTAQSTPISGSLTDGVNGFGADGGRVKSVVVNGVTYTFNFGPNPTITGSDGSTVNGMMLSLALAAGAMLTVNMASGEYTYVSAANVGSGMSQQVGFVLVDKDGDLSNLATLTITVDPADGPMVARDDFVVSRSGSFDIPDWALLANDSGPNSSIQAITSIVSVAGLTATRASASTSISAANDGESFVYQSQAGGQSANAKVTVVDVDGGGPLNGSFLDEILIDGNSGSTLNGNSGDDILIGNGGDDTLNGGEGNDILVGGAGGDELNGGSGNDTASYIDASSGVSVTLNNSGNASGGSNVGGGAAGDVLSSIENLIGSQHGDTLAGGGQNNVLSGLLGNDGLYGGGGNDVLIGGRGNDTMSGGSASNSDGKDTFLWLNGDADGGTDTLLNFTRNFNGASNGDRLDLSDLLIGEHGTVGDIGNLLNYLEITSSALGGVGGAALDTTIKVSTSGTGDFTNPDQTIVLQDVNLLGASGVGGYGAGGDTGSVILAMLNDGTLNVDTV